MYVHASSREKVVLSARCSVLLNKAPCKGRCASWRQEKSENTGKRLLVCMHGEGVVASVYEQESMRQPSMIAQGSSRPTPAATL